MSSGTLDATPNRTRTITFDNMDTDITLVSLGDAAMVVCDPVGSTRILNIYPHATGTRVDVVNLCSHAQALRVSCGVAPYTTVYIPIKTVKSFVSVNGEWIPMLNVDP